MQALRFHEFGLPDVLRLETVSDPKALAGHAVVAVQAASINPSDVVNLAGRFTATTLPRTRGTRLFGRGRRWSGRVE